MGGCCAAAQQEKYEDNFDGVGDVEEMLRELGAADEAASSTVELVITCRSLGSGVNPAVFVSEIVGDDRKLIGRTETAPNATDPQFVQTVTTVYQFEQVQNLVFEVMHEEKSGEMKLLGSMSITLPRLLEESPYTGSLWSQTSSAKAGDITIAAEERSKKEGPQFEVLFNFSCDQLESKNLMGAGGSDPFLVISRVVEGTFQPVVKTEHFENCTRATWKPIVVKLDRLCRDDFNCWLMLEVFDWEASGRHQLIGHARTTLAMMLSRYHREFDLINDKKKGKGKGKNEYVRSGVLRLDNIEIETSHSFLEYVKGGSVEINLTICVDFSSSNGRCNEPTSLHYKDPNRSWSDNEYVQALRGVVKVLGEYDKDQDFPFYGFGADAGQGLSDIFTVDPHKPEVHGIDGVLKAYWDCLDRVVMGEPTHFSKCLRKAYNVAQQRDHGSNVESYQLILFITDGKIDDLQESVDIIVQCADLPVSILIIGVGRGPFDDMEYLDGDQRPLRASDGSTPMRDLVGFVPFHEYRDNPEQLARETLREIPKQFTKWAKLHKIKPPSKRGEPPPSAASPPPETPVNTASAPANNPYAGSGVVINLKKEPHEGMGIAFTSQGSSIVVTGVQPNTPAERHHIKLLIGFRLAQINGQDIYNLTDAAKLVAGATHLQLCFEPMENDGLLEVDEISQQDSRSSALRSKGYQPRDESSRSLHRDRSRRVSHHDRDDRKERHSKHRDRSNGRKRKYRRHRHRTDDYDPSSPASLNTPYIPFESAHSTGSLRGRGYEEDPIITRVESVMSGPSMLSGSLNSPRGRRQKSSLAMPPV